MKRGILLLYLLIFKNSNLGGWYYNMEPKDYYIEPYQAMEEPHQHLHVHGQEVVKLYESGQREAAIRVFQQDVAPDLEAVRSNLNHRTFYFFYHIFPFFKREEEV